MCKAKPIIQLMKVFHYSRLDDWNSIKRGSFKTNNSPGLAANKRLAPLSDKGWKIGCSFSLLEPEPKQWTRSTTFKYAWPALISNTGSLLLSVNLEKHINTTFVVDWGHREAFLQNTLVATPEKYVHQTETKAQEAYVESMMPIEEYLNRKKELDYSLPEVITTEIIPLSDLEISSTQPRLEGELNKCVEGSEAYRDTREEIALLPELRNWARLNGDRKLIKAFEEREIHYRELSLRPEIDLSRMSSKER